MADEPTDKPAEPEKLPHNGFAGETIKMPEPAPPTPPPTE
jgi:hypothetical protein